VIVIKYEHIKTIQHNIGNGITEPKFATTDSNTLVVIKTLNGPEGNLVLFNEYFCYRLAILLGIKMPTSGICYIDNNTEILSTNVTNANRGFGFYSTYLLKVIPLIETIISLIKNKEDFYKILLFDHLIFNTDRNKGNLLVGYSKSNIFLYAIDHSHVFINQAIWDASCLKRGIANKDYFSTKILENNKYLYNMFLKTMPFDISIIKSLIPLFQTSITRTFMENIIESIPKDWIPENKDIKALFEYLIYRLEYLEDISITIHNYIKK